MPDPRRANAGSAVRGGRDTGHETAGRGQAAGGERAGGEQPDRQGQDALREAVEDSAFGAVLRDRAESSCSRPRPDGRSAPGRRMRSSP